MSAFTPRAPVIAATTYVLPTASSIILGGIKVGNGLAIDGSGILSVTAAGGTPAHNDLAGLQGGTVDEYYHLTGARHAELTGGGNSTLHYHSSDREVSEFALEAGEDLTIGDTVKVTTNKFYKATNTDPLVVGIIKATTSATFSATAVFNGKITLSGLSAGSPYFAGTTSVISSTAPTSGYVHRLGQAISSTILLVNIEEPVLLS